MIEIIHLEGLKNTLMTLEELARRWVQRRRRVLERRYCAMFGALFPALWTYLRRYVIKLQRSWHLQCIRFYSSACLCIWKQYSVGMPSGFVEAINNVYGSCQKTTTTFRMHYGGVSSRTWHRRCLPLSLNTSSKKMTTNTAFDWSSYSAPAICTKKDIERHHSRCVSRIRRV